MTLQARGLKSVRLRWRCPLGPDPGLLGADFCCCMLRGAVVGPPGVAAGLVFTAAVRGPCCSPVLWLERFVPFCTATVLSCLRASLGCKLPMELGGDLLGPSNSGEAPAAWDPPFLEPMESPVAGEGCPTGVLPDCLLAKGCLVLGMRPKGSRKRRRCSAAAAAAAAAS